MTSSTVQVRGTARRSRQGDIRLVDILERMGCRVTEHADGVAVSGGPMSAQPSWSAHRRRSAAGGRMYNELVQRGHANKDFSMILELLRGRL